MRALLDKDVVLGVTGGIAAYKSAYLARSLVGAGANVTVVMSNAATRFVTPLTFEALTGKECLTDEAMFAEGAAIRHVELARSADCLVVAPATANTIAKISCGFADSLLTSSILASHTPVLLVPSMHADMWENELTQRNLRGLPKRFRVMAPDEGALASGDEGKGRFPEVRDIVYEVASLVTPQDLEGRCVVVTGGPTRERLDPVRVLTNPSSGRMGIALARAAASRGASVRLVLGPTDLAPPRELAGRSLTVTRVETAREMLEAVEAGIEGADALLMAAAVADERPAGAGESKIRKEDMPGNLRLEPTADILKTLKDKLAGLVTLGFAAETDNVEESGRGKLESKCLNLLFANPVDDGRGFQSEENEGFIIERGGPSNAVGPVPKEDLAENLLDRVAVLLS